ncbi:MAG: type 1 glutamine amidotransferase, partial [Treponema sp.]|nr:type 1 glutamine amidotransferase [Treponema sp.]
MRIHYIQHEEFETPGNILTWAAAKAYPLARTLVYSAGRAERSFPSPDDFDWLVIMGGSMNVYENDRYPWLDGEKELVRKAAERGKTILGFCLGGQLIAAALGGRVTKNSEREIGWWPVSLKPAARARPELSFLPGSFRVFQWHGDTFSTLPPGAVLLAESGACKNQAFVIGRNIWGFQFHWEMTGDIIANLALNCAGELGPG